MMRISIARAIVRNPAILIIEELENTDQVMHSRDAGYENNNSYIRQCVVTSFSTEKYYGKKS